MYKLNDLKKELKKKITDFDDKMVFERKRLEIALKISEARKEEGFTQEELAQKLKTTQSVVSRIEKGHQNITLDLLFKIAQILRKDIQLQMV